MKTKLASYMLSARLCEGNVHVVTIQLNMYMYHTFNLCACMNACWSKTSCPLSTVLSQRFLLLRTYLWPQYFLYTSGESSFWLTSNIASITQHISVVSVHTAWIWYTITRSHGVIRQKPIVNCKASQEPRHGYMRYSVSYCKCKNSRYRPGVAQKVPGS